MLLEGHGSTDGHLADRALVNLVVGDEVGLAVGRIAESWPAGLRAKVASDPHGELRPVPQNGV